MITTTCHIYYCNSIYYHHISYWNDAQIWSFSDAKNCKKNNRKNCKMFTNSKIANWTFLNICLQPTSQPQAALQRQQCAETRSSKNTAKHRQCTRRRTALFTAVGLYTVYTVHVESVSDKQHRRKNLKGYSHYETGMPIVYDSWVHYWYWRRNYQQLTKEILV